MESHVKIILMILPHNVYIHVPYCMSKCNYCAFFSVACTAPDWDTYADGIISEIDKFADLIGPAPVPTIFFGGGTPSLMPAAVFSKILTHINAIFHIEPNAEITIESNPGTIDDKKLDEFIAAGMNRLSVGVQALDDMRLRFLGRRHDAATAVKLLRRASSRNIRVSGDFIYGLPGDTTEYVADLCAQINDLGLKHCSMYELTIEPGTPFAKMQPDMPSNEEMAEMYDAIGRKLNLPRYEVSNYAATPDECRHNKNVWDGEPYVGFGRGAAGRVLVDGDWYEQMGGGIKFEKMAPRDRAMEKIITGMRTIRGVKMTPDVAAVINNEFARTARDMITFTPDGRMHATQRGLLILDDLLVQLIR